MGLIQAGEKNRREKAHKKDESTSKKHASKEAGDKEQVDAAENAQPAVDQGDQPQGDGDDSAGAPSSSDNEGGEADADEGSGEAQDGSDDQGGEDVGGAQGGSPEASGEGEDSEAQAPGQMGSPAADSGGGPQGSVDLSKIPISPALQDEYQKLNVALMKVLYSNQRLAEGVLKGVLPQGPAKIKSVAMTSCTLIGQLNKKLHFIQETPQIVLPFVKDVVSHVIDLAEQVKGIQFSDQEAVAALGTALEMTLRTYGVHSKQMKALQQHLPPEQLAHHYDQYQKAHAYARPAMDANQKAFLHDHLAQQQGSGAPQPPAGQGGGPPGQGGPPPQGGPPQGGPPQGGGGGMIAQASAQQQPAPAGATESEADEAEAQAGGK